jgi:peptidoglycan hydrolase-like protein with peptidoglycan-binding domain
MINHKNSFNVSGRFLTKAGLMLAAVVVMGVPTLTHAALLTRQLEVGMTGSDVSAVQAYLAKDVTIYPQGLVTGYFGLLTKAAVSNFQSRNDIPSVGRIGPLTLTVLNLHMSGELSANVRTPVLSAVILNVAKNSASVAWNTSEPVKGVVYYSMSPLVVSEYPHSVTVSGSVAMTDASFRSSQNVTLPNLLPNTTYYYLVHATNQLGGVSVSYPATFKTTN